MFYPSCLCVLRTICRAYRFCTSNLLNKRAEAAQLPAPRLSETRNFMDLPVELQLHVIEVSAHDVQVALMNCTRHLHMLLFPYVFNAVVLAGSVGKTYRFFDYVSLNPRFAAVVRSLYIRPNSLPSILLGMHATAAHTYASKAEEAGQMFGLNQLLRDMLPKLENLSTLVIPDIAVMNLPIDVNSEQVQSIHGKPCITSIAVYPSFRSMLWSLVLDDCDTSTQAPQCHSGSFRAVVGSLQPKRLMHTCVPPPVAQLFPCSCLIQLVKQGGRITALILRSCRSINWACFAPELATRWANMQRLEVMDDVPGSEIMTLVRHGYFANLRVLVLKKEPGTVWDTQEKVANALTSFAASRLLDTVVYGTEMSWRKCNGTWKGDPRFKLPLEWYETSSL